MAIEIERVVVTDEVLTPYFWVSGVAPSRFEAAAADDPTIRGVRKLDEFDDSVLYRAEWTKQVQSVLYVYTEIDAVILEATGTDQRWELRIRFDDRDQLGDFQDYCEANRIAFSLQQLTRLSQPKTGGQYGLTPKQQEALVAAWGPATSRRPGRRRFRTSPTNSGSPSSPSRSASSEPVSR